MTRDDYARLVAAGIFEDVSVELIGGAVVRMPAPRGPEHDGTLQLLGRRLATAYADRAEVRVRSTFDAGERAQPEPDLAVVPAGDYRAAHPTVAWLVVEVADSSLTRDRNAKALVYARANVEEYWIVDLVHRTVEVRTQPTDDGYARLVTLRRGDTLLVPRLANAAIAIADVLR